MKIQKKILLSVFLLIVLTAGANANPDQPPVVTKPIRDTTFIEDYGFTYVVNGLYTVFHDPDSPTLIFSASVIGGGLQAQVVLDSVLQIYPLPDSNGVYKVIVTATDDSAKSVSDTFKVTITPVYDLPRVQNAVADLAIPEDSGKIFVDKMSHVFLHADGYRMTFTVVSSDSNKLKPKISNDSLYASTQNNANGLLTITLRANDSLAGLAIDSFHVTITPLNDAPQVQNAISAKVIREDSGKVFIAKLSNVFTDVDGDQLNYDATSSRAILSVNISNDTLYVLTMPDSNGITSIIVSATDPSSATANDTFQISITPVNDAPRVKTHVADGSRPEDSGKFFIVKLTSTFFDVDGDAMTFGVSNSNPLRLTTLISNDSLYVITIKDSNGVVNVYLSATDPSSAVGRDTFQFTVVNVNDPPFIKNALRDTTSAEDFGQIFVAKLSTIFADIDNPVLNYSVVYVDGDVAWNVSNDSLFLISVLNFYGAVNIAVEADDGLATVDDTFRITINAVNDAPQVQNHVAPLHINEEAGKIFIATMSSIFHDPDNVGIIFTASSSNSTKLAVSISTDSLYVTTAKDSSGAILVFLSASDSLAATGRDTIQVIIDPVDDAPFVIQSIRDTSFVQDFGKRFIRKLTAVFGDLDNPVLSYTPLNLSAGVAAQVSGDSLYVSSTPGFFGSVDIKITASDGSLSVSDTFRVSVNDITPPQLYIGALASPALNIVRFAVGADENLNSVTLTVNAQSVTLTKQGNTYFGDYLIASAGTLTVSASGTDLTGNLDTVNRTYHASLLSRPVAYGKYNFTGSSNGYILLSSAHSVGVSSQWKQIGESVEWLVTGSASDLNARLQYGDVRELKSLVKDFDEAKIGVYEFTGGQWTYAGGEGEHGTVTAHVRGNQIAVFYNPDHTVVPKEFSLEQNYPNPFNPTTTIKYAVPQESNVVIRIYNILGQEVRTLINEKKGIGKYQIQWNGTNNSGAAIASGIYLYRIRAGNFTQTKKMIFLK